ncbi:DUF481 domain-containing protein [Gemmatimonadota bacterium]
MNRWTSGVSLPFRTLLAAAALAVVAMPASALAQAVPPSSTPPESPPVQWSFESEVGASVFFGASDQTTVATKFGVDRRGRLFEVESDFSYLYGEATDEEGSTFVNKRSWSLESNLDYRGFSRVNPYAFGSALSSLEKRIDLRVKGGAGAKVTALDSEVSSLDFAVAILAEQTFKDTEDDGDQEVLARWVGEVNFRRSFSEERMVFQVQADYNPVFDQFDNYTIQAEASLAFKLSEIVSLKLSVEDNYDSRAVDRGARDNNDGRVLFSVLASF